MRMTTLCTRTGALPLSRGCCSRSRPSARRSCCSAAGAPTSGGTCSAARVARVVRLRRDRVLLGARASTAADRSRDLHLYTWIPVGGFHVDSASCSTRCRSCFVLLITGVGSLIHIYSVGYMAHDPERRRFFGYLNLFIAAMLLLVLANNYLALYVGWEGVGLASYLLIGF